MAWVKLDDQFFAHPKVIDLPQEAKLLYLCGLTHCAAQLTDGFISQGAVRLVAAMVDVPQGHAGDLIAAGLWDEVAGGFQVHDFLDYNPSGEQVKRDRALNARRQQDWREREAARKAAEAAAEASVTNGVTDGASNAVSNTVTPHNAVSNTRPVPVPHPVPLPRPDPDQGGGTPGADAPPPPPKVRQSGKKASEETRIPDDFPLTEAMREWAALNAPGVNVDIAHVEFCTFWRGDGRKKHNWRATWENGMVKAFERLQQRPQPRAGPTGPNGRATSVDLAAEAKRLSRQRSGASPPTGPVVEAAFTERRH